MRTSERRRFKVLHCVVDGRDLFANWLAGLKDDSGRAAVNRRIDRIEEGNLGDCRPVGSGVSELRIHKGPGYRVCFGMIGSNLVLLLCGGDKSTQPRDIRMAKGLWDRYRRMQ